MYGNSTVGECLGSTRSESCDTLARMSQTSDEEGESDEQGADSGEEREKFPNGLKTHDKFWFVDEILEMQKSPLSEFKISLDDSEESDSSDD